MNRFGIAVLNCAASAFGAGFAASSPGGAARGGPDVVVKSLLNLEVP
jgi:hypothetical protein